MAKYYFTSGKRKGKVYQEYYYTMGGQQIVSKKSNYCPVNTKWLSKEEFKQYILQLIRDEYPNYLVVDELPEELESHIIYFLKQVNPDESIYYDVYVYDNEQLKKIVFKGADIADLDYIRQVINDLTSKSLKNVYNANLTANKLLSTDANGIVTTSDKYTAAYPLTMTGHQIGLVRLHNSASGTFVWNFSFDEYGRVYSAAPIDRMLILGRILWDYGTTTITTPSNDCALFFLNTHAGNFFLAQICVTTNLQYRKVVKILSNNDSYFLPKVEMISDTSVKITATGNCRAVIFTFDTRVT